MNDIKIFGELIRRELKQREITQEEFAKMLKVSVPTIKRWFKCEGVMLKDWIKMLDYLGLSLSEAVLEAESFRSKKFSYTLAQEEVLARESGLLAFFDLLLNGKKTSQIARSYSLDESSIIFYLSKLDKIGLIKWLPKNKVKLLVNGEPNWIIGGPLSKKFRKQIVDIHIGNYMDDRDHLKINIYTLSLESAGKLSALMKETSEKIRGWEIKDNSISNDKKITTVILGHGTNKIPILSEIPKRSQRS